jgi:hypothetical protein
VKPRGYFATFFMLATISTVTFGVSWSYLSATMLGMPFAAVLCREGLPAGLTLGIIFGGSLAFRLRAITATTPVGPDVNVFLGRVTLHLAELGYHPEQTIGCAYTFRPSLSVGYPAGRITLFVERPSDDATMLGPAVHIKALRKLLGRDVLDLLPRRRD